MRAPLTTPPPFGILGAEPERLHPRNGERRRAHGAGLERDPQGAIVEARRTEFAAAARIASISACAVGSVEPRIALRASATISSPQSDDRADRHFALLGGFGARSSARRIGEGSGKLMPPRLAKPARRSHMRVVGRRLQPGCPGLLDFERGTLTVVSLRADLHRPGLDIEGRRLPTLRGDAVVRRGDLRRFGAAELVDVDEAGRDGGDAATRMAMIRTKMTARMSLPYSRSAMYADTANADIAVPVAPSRPLDVDERARAANGRRSSGLLRLVQKIRIKTMSRVCELTGKGRQVGNNVSHANNKTKRTFLPNLQNVTLISDALGQSVKLRVSTHGLRSVEHVGGLDNWLLKTSDDKLSAKARKLKREIAKKAAEPGRGLSSRLSC